MSAPKQTAREFEAESRAHVMAAVAAAAGPMPPGWDWEAMLDQVDRELAEEAAQERQSSSGFSAFLHQIEAKRAMDA